MVYLVNIQHIWRTLAFSQIYQFIWKIVNSTLQNEFQRGNDREKDATCYILHCLDRRTETTLYVQFTNTSKQKWKYPTHGQKYSAQKWEVSTHATCYILHCLDRRTETTLYVQFTNTSKQKWKYPTHGQKYSAQKWEVPTHAKCINSTNIWP